MPGGKTSSVPRAAGTAGVSLNTVTEGARGGARFLSHLLNAETSPGWPKRQTPSLSTHAQAYPPSLGNQRFRPNGHAGECSGPAPQGTP